LGALERLRPGYLAEYYERQAVGNAQLSQLLAHGSDLLVCEQLDRLDRILARIDHGERGAMVELEVLALFVRCGYVPVTEPDRDGKVPDFAVDIADQRVFVEVIGPPWSDPAATLFEQLKDAAETLFEVLDPNQRLQIGFLVEPTAPTVEQIVAALDGLQHNTDVVLIEDAHVCSSLQSVSTSSGSTLVPLPQSAAGALSKVLLEAGW
jgi:hypothetical protein